LSTCIFSMINDGRNEGNIWCKWEMNGDDAK
jgi:hypothetical protein